MTVNECMRNSQKAVNPPLAITHAFDSIEDFIKESLTEGHSNTPVAVTNADDKFKRIYALLTGVDDNVWKDTIVEQSIKYGQAYFNAPIVEWKPEWKSTLGSAVESRIAQSLPFIRLATATDAPTGRANPSDFIVVDEEHERTYSLENKVSVSQRLGFLIPPAHHNDVILLTHINLLKQMYQVGLLRCQRSFLSEHANRDEKRSLNKAGKEAITWFSTGKFAIESYEESSQNAPHS